MQNITRQRFAKILSPSLTVALSLSLFTLGASEPEEVEAHIQKLEQQAELISDKIRLLTNERDELNQEIQSLKSDLASFKRMEERKAAKRKPKEEDVSSRSMLTNPRIEVEQPIILSIPVNETKSEFRHLSIKLIVIIGRVETEEKDPAFDLMAQLKKEQFMEIADKFKPFITDRVHKVATAYTYEQLLLESTKAEIKRHLVSELNGVLSSYGMQPRFKQVLFTSFIFSD